MCDCMKEIEDRIKEHFKQEVPDHKEIRSVRFDNRALMLDSGKIALSSPITVVYTRETKQGKEQRKEKVYPLTHTYCPFCGMKNSV